MNIRNYLLKFSFWVLLFLSNNAFVEAKNRNEFMHLFDVYIGGGYPFVFDDFIETKTSGLFSGNIGLGYGFRMQHLWFELDLEYQRLISLANYNISGTDIKMYDTQGKEMLLHYEFENAMDIQFFNSLNLPILIGYYNEGFYIGTGPKIGFCYMLEKTDLYYTTSATYGQYIEDFENMPNHYYTKQEETCKKQLLPTFRFSFVAEVGYDFFVLLNKTNYNSLKLSLFTEYNFINLKSDNMSLSVYDIDGTNPTKIRLLPFYYVKASNSNRVTPYHSVSIGVKLSWMINIPHKNCKNCNMWKRPKRVL